MEKFTRDMETRKAAAIVLEVDELAREVFCLK